MLECKVTKTLLLAIKLTNLELKPGCTPLGLNVR